MLYFCTEVDWDELETALRNINNKQLDVSLNNEVKYESETWDHIKRLATLCKQVQVDKLRLSEGWCVVIISTNEISPYEVYLQSGDDVTRLHHLVSQYQSWQVTYLDLLELGSDDWALLAQLLPTLTSVPYVLITSNSTSHPGRDTLRLLWDKTESDGSWEVNNEEYEKSEEENFDKICNLLIPA